MTSEARADRILDEFTEGAYRGERHTSIRHGLARVLRHLADTEAGYADEESWYAVPANTLTDLADALEAPTLLDRAMAGDKQAARQFLHEAGFTDASGNWLPQYQSHPSPSGKDIDHG
jgi:hypothetical protein